MRNTFLPTRDADKLLWLQTFAAKLPAYQAKYNLSDEEIEDMAACALFFAYWLNYQNQYNGYDQKLITFKNEMKDGIPEGAEPPVPPVPPSLGAPPPTVAPGIFKRASNIAQVIKTRLNYTVSDGKDLGIEGTHVEEDDINEVKPVLKIKLINGGHPDLQWVKKKMGGIEFYVDRGNGQFIFLALDTVPNYTDTYDLPAAPAVWKYKAIYRKDDHQVGLWSEIYSVTVQAG